MRCVTGIPAEARLPCRHGGKDPIFGSHRSQREQEGGLGVPVSSHTFAFCRLCKILLCWAGGVFVESFVALPCKDSFQALLHEMACADCSPLHGSEPGEKKEFVPSDAFYGTLRFPVQEPSRCKLPPHVRYYDHLKKLMSFLRVLSFVHSKRALDQFAKHDVHAGFNLGA